MAQQLKFLIAHLVELGPVPSILMLAYIYNSSPKRSKSSSDKSPWAPANKVYIHVLKHTHKIK